MKLKQILDNFDYIVENGSVDTEICHLVMDSRKVEHFRCRYGWA